MVSGRSSSGGLSAAGNVAVQLPRPQPSTSGGTGWFPAPTAAAHEIHGSRLRAVLVIVPPEALSKVRRIYADEVPHDNLLSNVCTMLR